MQNKQFNTGSYVLMVLLVLGGLMSIAWSGFIILDYAARWGKISASPILVSIAITLPWFAALLGIIKRHKFGVILVKIISGVLIAFTLWVGFMDVYTEIYRSSDAYIGTVATSPLSIPRFLISFVFALLPPFLLSYLAHKEAQRLKKLK